jgi:hypothetical protein
MQIDAVGFGLLILLAALALGGCDVQGDVTLSAEVKTAAQLQEQVTALEAEVAFERERADRLQKERDAARQGSYVAAGDERISVHLDTQAALVLIFAIVGLVTVLVARFKYAPEA